MAKVRCGDCGEMRDYDEDCACENFICEDCGESFHKGEGKLLGTFWYCKKCWEVSEC